MKWQMVELGELAEFRNGLNFDRGNFGIGIKVIGVADFQDYQKPKYETLNEINPDGVVSEDDLLEDEDILFVRSNGNRELIGRTLFIHKPPEPISFSGFCIRLRFISEKIHPRFFAYFFKTDVIRRTLSAVGGGTNIVSLNQRILKNLKVPFPPLETQERIASFLLNYDDLIENNNRRIALLEEAIHRLYKEWFVHLRFPGYEHTPITAGIPTGWRKALFKEIAEEITVRIEPSDVESNTPYVGLEHIPRQSIALTTWGSSDEVTSTKFAFQRGDILFGKIRPYFHKVVFAPISGICSSDTIVIRPIDPNFYGQTLALSSSVPFVHYTSKTVKEGSKMPRANWGIMKQYPTWIPAEKILNSFNEFVINATKQIENLVLINKKLYEARDALLPRLMNGSLAV